MKHIQFALTFSGINLLFLIIADICHIQVQGLESLFCDIFMIPAIPVNYLMPSLFEFFNVGDQSDWLILIVLSCTIWFIFGLIIDLILYLPSKKSK